LKTILLLLLTSGLCAQRPELALSQEEFDSFDCCWRKLNAEKRYAEGAALLADYIEKSPNAKRKNPLTWHAAQLYASAGNNNKALQYFRKTYNVFYKWFGDRQWYYFAKANAAFVKRDKPRLERIITKWEKTFPKDDNYKSLLKLRENWDKPYREAFK
jgi:tetratricopeptide (TPR) repeat protein